MSKKKWLKTGPLSAEEREYIEAYVHVTPIDEIAANLKRNRETIEKYCNKRGWTYKKALPKIRYFDANEDSETHERKQALRQKNWYDEVRSQLLDQDEIRYFENRWVELYEQFNKDVMASEEMQMKQLITLDILMNRSLKDRKKHSESIQSLEDTLKKLYQQQREGILEEANRIFDLEERLADARNSLGSYDNHHKDLLQKFNDIMEKLKGTREQRVKIIEESKKDWTGLLKLLEDEENRQFQGQHMTLMKQLADATRKEYYNYHEFADRTVCPPVMTAESLEHNEKLDAEEKKKQETLQTNQT